METAPIEVNVVSGILPEAPQESRDLSDGGSITWNLLCGTTMPLPCVDGSKAVFSLEDIVRMRDNMAAGILGIYPSAYVGHEGRTSGSPAVGTILDTAIAPDPARPGEFLLYFKTRWTKDGVEILRQGTYKYVSIEADMRADCGWVIKAVALTNEPAYRPMPQVAASSIQQTSPAEGGEDNDKTIGGEMTEEILKLIDPGKFLEMLIATPEGAEVLAKFYRDRADKFMPAPPPENKGGETPPAAPPADGGQTPPPDGGKGGEQTPKDRRDEAVSTAEDDLKRGDKPEGDKNVQASSIIDQASSFFDREIKKLHTVGINYPSGLLNQTRMEVMASAYTAGAQKAAEEGLKKLQGFNPSGSTAQAPMVFGSSAGTTSPFRKQVYRFLQGGR